MGKLQKKAFDEGARDCCMARLAAARSLAQSAVDAIDEALAAFVTPDDDPKGKDRDEAIDMAIEAAGMCTRALEAAQEEFEETDPEQAEPWDDAADEDEED